MVEGLKPAVLLCSLKHAYYIIIIVVFVVVIVLLLIIKILVSGRFTCSYNIVCSTIKQYEVSNTAVSNRTTLM